MKEIVCDERDLSPSDTLECGQTFRFRPFRGGYAVFSQGRACRVRTEDGKTVIECGDGDEGYFRSYFDLGRDYGEINERVRGYGVPALTRAAEACRGLRLLRQDPTETMVSFVISQNNNIPRIKGIIERICDGLGEERSFMGEPYRAFPSADAIRSRSPEYYRALGAGYRDAFIVGTADRLAREGTGRLSSLPSAALKRELMTYPGIGPKVADCVALFGFGRTDSFPVDTWIEKLYHEDFGGTETDRNRINSYFTGMFGEDSGIVQQYLFHAKRKGII